MHRREEMEAAHQESIQMSKIFHLREAAAGDNGGRFGDHMGTHPLEGQMQLDQIGIHDKNCARYMTDRFVACQALPRNYGFVQLATFLM